jgi:ATP-dependent RNA helicase MSS116, mitochondrial
MLKTSLPRHARLGNVVCRQLSTFSSIRPLRLQSLQSSAAQQLSIARSPLRSTCLQSIATRLYSSEAVAEKQQDDSSVGSQRITKFADLPQLGVHPSLVSAITEGMRYEDMTDVQSLTINSALRGVDL